MFVKPPQHAEVPEETIWKMRKRGYGLYDASRNLYLKVAEKLRELGCKALIGDEALFYYQKIQN